MIIPLHVRSEGATQFVATDRDSQPLQVILDCPQGLPAGTDVRLSNSTFHSYTDGWEFDGVRVAGGSGRVVLGHELPRTWTEKTRGGVSPAGGGLVGRPVNEVYLCAVQVTQSLSPGARLIFALRIVPSVHAGIEGALRVSVRAPDAATFDAVGEPIPLRNRPGPPARLDVRNRIAPETNGGVRVVIVATDARLNLAPGYTGTLFVQADGEVGGLPAQLEIEEDDGGRALIEGISLPTDGPARIEVRDAAQEAALDLAARSGPILSPSDAARQHFFGAIHFHTRLSVDGDRAPRDAYAYARDILNLDVVAMTDHAPIGPGWDECLAVNAEFYDPGRFVTIPAWESSNAYGHANLYLRRPDVDAGPWLWNPEVNPSEVDWPDDVILVPHHTNTGQIIARGAHRDAWRQGRYWAKYDWSIPNPRARLVEIVQGRGNFEANALDAEWGIHMGEQNASVQDALAQGWRLGFVAGTDNHEGHPTQRNGEYVGLTCFRAAERTREAIWQAMDRRQTYATSGVPIVCEFFVNDICSGREGTLAPGDPVSFSARLHGTAPIAVVEIISQGRCVWRDQPDAWDVELDGVELPAPTGAWAYYYLRLRQADGHRAWLSPVWLDYAAG